MGAVLKINWRRLLGKRWFQALCLAVLLVALAILFDLIVTALITILLIAFALLAIGWLISKVKAHERNQSRDED